MPRGKQVFHAVDPKRTQGLFPRKYTVTRTDGSSEKGASTRTAASSSWTSTTTPSHAARCGHTSWPARRTTRSWPVT